MAATVGLHRQIEAMVAGRPDQHGIDPAEGWRVHIEGACGELAVAKFLGYYWDGSVNTFQAFPDLRDLEVRTRSDHNYELLIRPNSDPNKIYVHVTGKAPHFWVRGWFLGADARRDEWSKCYGGRPPAWFVPNDVLHTDWPFR